MNGLGKFLWDALASCAARAGVELDPGTIRPFCELGLRAGAVPLEGPLTHDLVLPTRRAAKVFSFNVFSHGRELGFRQTALAFARDVLGRERELAGLFASSHADFDGGFSYRPSGSCLKLYATGRFQELARAHGVPPDGALALGLDLTRDGFCRGRRYLPVERGHADVTWPAPPCDFSHRLLTELSGPPAKTTQSTIFLPRAPAAALLPLVSVVRPEDFDRGLFDEVAACARANALELRAVAHQVDRYSDGRVETDIVVAAGAVITRQS